MHESHDLRAVAGEVASVGKWAKIDGETDLAYLQRYVRKIMHWPDAKWDLLSDDAQSVVNMLANGRLSYKNIDKGALHSTRNVKARLKELMIDNPTWTNMELYTALTDEGCVVSYNTITLIRSDFLHSLRCLLKGGMIAEPYATKFKDLGLDKRHNSRIM